jgi:ESF2/ABP1 family protein
MDPRFVLTSAFKEDRPPSDAEDDDVDDFAPEKTPQAPPLPAQKKRARHVGKPSAAAPADDADAEADVSDGNVSDTHANRSGSEGESNEPPQTNARAPGKLSGKKLEAYNKKMSRRGVVYLSRVPPFMKIAKLRNLLEQYGEVHRIYLVPEDATARKRRVKKGGNRKKKFVEGWVEYGDKSIAKRVAMTLHGTMVGGRGFFAHDIWSMKYLSKFKWHHLTEKLAYERRVREKKMQAEMAQATRENNFYLSRVDQARSIQKMRQRRAAAGLPQENDEDVVRRKFFQRGVVSEAPPAKRAKTSSE